MTESALVLAGTRPGGDPLARDLGVAHKGLIEIAATPILERVILALRAAGMNRVLVSADDPEVVALAHSLGAEICPPASGPSARVAAPSRVARWRPISSIFTIRPTTP